MGRKPLTQEAIDAFREEACKAALSLYATHSEVSLRQLARAMGCSLATPYRYFAHKEELFMAVRTRCFERFATHLRDALARTHDPLDRLRLLCRLYADYAHIHPTEFHLMFSLGQPDYTDYPWAQDAAKKSWGIVSHSAQRAIDAGCLVGDPNTVAHMFWSATHGVVMLSLSERLRMGISYEALLPPLVDSLIASHSPARKDPAP